MNTLNPSTIEYIIADLENKKFSYLKDLFNTQNTNFDAGKLVGQIEMLELLIANYKDNLSELLIDIENDRRK